MNNHRANLLPTNNVNSAMLFCKYNNNFTTLSKSSILQCCKTLMLSEAQSIESAFNKYLHVRSNSAIKGIKKYLLCKL